MNAEVSESRTGLHLPRLVCPECRNRISVKPEELRCESCGFVPEKAAAEFIDFIGENPIGEIRSWYQDSDYKKGLRAMEKLYEAHYRSGSLSGSLELAFKRHLMNLVISDERPYLDVGCGVGAGFPVLGYPSSIVGVDVSKDRLRMCAEVYPQSVLVRCDMGNSPFEDESFGSIFSMGTLEHVFELERLLSGIERVLKRDGRFYVMIPCEGGWLWSFARWMAHLKYSKMLKINYRKFARIEHVNTAWGVENALRKFFIIEKKSRFPFRVGGNWANFTVSYRLAKRC